MISTTLAITTSPTNRDAFTRKIERLITIQMIIPWLVVTVAVIGIDDVGNMNIDAAELVDDGGSGIEIDTGVIIKFNIIEILQSMNGLIDAIKSGVSEFVEFAIHGEGYIKITWSIEEENLVLGGIDGEDEVDVGAGGKRQGMVAIIDATEINSEWRVE